jgi:hypothetical protein
MEQSPSWEYNRFSPSHEIPRFSGTRRLITACREFFKLLKILSLSAQYIYPLLKFVVTNRYLLLDNADLYSIKTRNSYDLHLPSTHLTKYQKGVHYAWIRVFSHLPTSVKKRTNETKVFTETLNRFLIDNLFYSVDEFINFKEESIV